MRSTHGSRPGTARRAPAATANAGPAVARMVLGARLRELRESQYISRPEAAEAIRTTDGHIGALELGRTACRLRDIADLLTIYSVADGGERAVLLGLAEQANLPGWWAGYDDVIPPWMETYLGLEQVATVIRSYDPQFVPGLLQTPAYARALVALGQEGSEACPIRRERRVELRMRRQEILHRPRPPHLWAVIDEAALRRPVGGPETMRAQIRHLIALCRLPHVTLQVLSLRAGGQVAAGGPVSLLRLAERGLPDVVYLEQLHGAAYPEEPEEIEFYRQLTDRVVTLAESATDTPAVLRDLLGGLPPQS